jgi:hypothetical protein
MGITMIIFSVDDSGLSCGLSRLALTAHRGRPFGITIRCSYRNMNPTPGDHRTLQAWQLLL